mgnify:FL=1
MIEINELQRKRAANIVWNCAGSYDFRPDFRAYDADGQADLYWNCIFGAARKHYDYSVFEALFRAVQQYEDAEIYENLLWIGLEGCVYQHELGERPALSRLRQSYARQYVRENSYAEDFQFDKALSLAHFQRVLGLNPRLDPYMEKLLNELEFPPELTAQEISERANELLLRWFQIRAEERKKERKNRLVQSFKRNKSKQDNRSFRRFGIGLLQHPQNSYGGSAAEGGQNKELKTKMSAEELRRFMETKYGRSIYSPAHTDKLERSLCVGRHEFCHLLVTRGDRPDAAAIQNGFEALSRQREAAQIERNRQSFRANIAQNRTSIARLTEKIQNSVLLHLQSSPTRANAGSLDSGRVWRTVHFGDERVFIKPEADDSGGLSVDILLDASTSQKSRQEIVSAQGYMVAESLTRCGIPCRVMSFCSMTGYTVLRIFRDYEHPADNRRIFEYVSNGCNRDGLAISAARELMHESRCEHRMLIVLSDVKPNDVVKTRARATEDSIPYEKQAGITDTALEVRRARAEGIAVICVFTGDDEDVPAAKLVYGSDFTRIKSLDMLADAVGRLIQNQIKNL